MMTTSRFWFAIAIALLLLFGINLLTRGTLYDVRLDFTEGKLFTVSDESRKMLRELEEPMKVRVFFSEKLATGLPVFQAYAARIRTLLQQFSDISDDKLQVEFLNPEPFTEAEDLAVAHGLEGVPLDTAGNKFYFGMSIENSTDDRGVLAFFDPARERFLEYDILRLITDMANPERKKIAVISTLPLRGSFGGRGMMALTQYNAPWMIYEQLEQLFDVVVVNKNDAVIPPDADALWVVHPAELSQENLYAIDQYIIKGGKALIMLDSNVNLAMIEQRESTLDPLLSAWGIHFSKGRVAADKASALHVETESYGSKLITYPNVTWMELGQEHMTDDSVITASLEKLRFIESGFFTQKENSSVVMQPLITTSVAAMKVDVEELEKEQVSLNLYRNYIPGGEPLILAAQVNGQVKSAFDKDKIKEAWQATYKSQSENPVNVIMVGDVDMLRDDFWAQSQEFMGKRLLMPTADNGAFILNALEYLTGESALIRLRTRGSKDRRFEILDELKREAENTFRAEEEALKEKLVQMEMRIRDLQSQGAAGQKLFSEEQAKEIASFRDAFLETRKQLRAVQRDLQHDINWLGSLLAFINIVAVAFFVLVAAFIVPPYLRRSRR